MTRPTDIMSLDKLVYDVGESIVGVADNLGRLVTVTTIFLPIFIISLAILVILLVALLIVSIFLQFKRLRAECRRRREENNRNELPSLGPTKEKENPMPGTYRRVASDPRLSPVTSRPLFTPTIIEPFKEKRVPMPFVVGSKMESSDSEEREKKLPLKQRSSIPVTMLMSSTHAERICLAGKNEEEEGNGERK